MGFPAQWWTHNIKDTFDMKVHETSFAKHLLHNIAMHLTQEILGSYSDEGIFFFHKIAMDINTTPFLLGIGLDSVASGIPKTFGDNMTNTGLIPASLHVLC